MTKTDIGEYIVGAYLKIILECDVIDYNARPPGGGLKGLEELDVIGLKFKTKEVFLCEVTTHLRGLLYGDVDETIQKLKTKHKRQVDYADEFLKDFPNRHFMIWSPIVPEGKITKKLREIETLELVINKEYSERINELRQKAKKSTNDTGNIFFRTLQILEHLK